MFDCVFLSYYRGVLVPGGFGTRGTDGKIAAAEWARTKKIPYLGKLFCVKNILELPYSAMVENIDGFNA